MCVTRAIYEKKESLSDCTVEYRFNNAARTDETFHLIGNFVMSRKQQGRDPHLFIRKIRKIWAS